MIYRSLNLEKKKKWRDTDSYVNMKVLKNASINKKTATIIQYK